MTIIAIPISRRSIFRVKDLLEIVFVEALFIIGLLLIKGLRSATSRSATSKFLRSAQLILLLPGRNIHHGRCP